MNKRNTPSTPKGADGDALACMHLLLLLARAYSGHERNCCLRPPAHGYYIDHPDPELGEQFMVNTLGVADRFI